MYNYVGYMHLLFENGLNYMQQSHTSYLPSNFASGVVVYINGIQSCPHNIPDNLKFFNSNFYWEKIENRTYINRHQKNLELLIFS
jgi:hypothetical protein